MITKKVETSCKTVILSKVPVFISLKPQKCGQMKYLDVCYMFVLCITSTKISAWPVTCTDRLSPFDQLLPCKYVKKPVF